MLIRPSFLKLSAPPSGARVVISSVARPSCKGHIKLAELNDLLSKQFLPASASRCSQLTTHLAVCCCEVLLPMNDLDQHMYTALPGCSASMHSSSLLIEGEGLCTLFL